MEISDIIEDSFKYPISDFKKFLILGIPCLIIGLFTLLFAFESISMASLANTTEEAILTSPIFSTFIISFLLFIIVLIICSIIMSGIGISIIKETIKPSNMLPDIELKTNILDGIKSIIVSLIYIGVPSIIFFILFGIVGVALGENSGIPILLLMLLYLIAIIVIGLLLTVAICRLAETNSIGEALNISNIIEIGKKIGFIKIFATLLICNVLLGILSLIGSFISMIPLIGTIIVMYLLYSYTLFVTYRAYGLLYRDKYGETFTQKAFQQTYTPIENNQAQEINNNGNIDTRNNNQTNDSSEAFMKKCSNCGYSNPEYAKICVNCGNEL